MQKLALAVLVVASCGRGPDAKPPHVTTARPIAPAVDPTDDAPAMAAYDKKQFGRCAELYMAVADHTAARSKAFALDSAACCYALDGKPDLAFTMLERSMDAGLHDFEQLQIDADLKTLRDDPRWPAFIAKAKDEFEKSLGEPALRSELLARYAEDQALLKSTIGKDKSEMEAASKALNAKNLPWLEEVVAKHGWPGKRLVGDDGANAMWLLVQHSDTDPAFQKLCLGLMEPLVVSGEVSAIDYAYLWDRVAVAEKRPQRYGTQFGETREPRPIEDEAHVDDRRRALGLPTMASYRKAMLKTYGPPKP